MSYTVFVDYGVKVEDLLIQGQYSWIRDEHYFKKICLHRDNPPNGPVVFELVKVTAEEMCEFQYHGTLSSIPVPSGMRLAYAKEFLMFRAQNPELRTDLAQVCLGERISGTSDHEPWYIMVSWDRLMFRREHQVSGGMGSDSNSVLILMARV